ncbi:hypothetical protein MMC18_004665 [Xylographa bjoerkii]|nr:hypothetical protein [Xylographa bjoerkii]
MNGTIASGLPFPPTYNNGTLQTPEILVYRTTIEGYLFFVKEVGIGTDEQRITRLVNVEQVVALEYDPDWPWFVMQQIDVGDRYAPLADIYNFAEISALDNRTLIKVDGYEVGTT